MFSLSNWIFIQWVPGGKDAGAWWPPAPTRCWGYKSKAIYMFPLWASVICCRVNVTLTLIGFTQLIRYILFFLNVLFYLIGMHFVVVGKLNLNIDMILLTKPLRTSIQSEICCKRAGEKFKKMWKGGKTRETKVQESYSEGKCWRRPYPCRECYSSEEPILELLEDECKSRCCGQSSAVSIDH